MVSTVCTYPYIGETHNGITTHSASSYLMTREQQNGRMRALTQAVPVMDSRLMSIYTCLAILGSLVFVELRDKSMPFSTQSTGAEPDLHTQL